MEFRTRKAHRWVVREKDLLKYWAVMITCVSVYLASGTISTLQHSESSFLWDWSSSSNGSSSGRSSGNRNAVVSATDSSTLSPSIVISNQTRPLFPVKPGGKGEQQSGATGIRLRGDGVVGRVWTSNASSILLQKAKILRRDTLEDSSSINDTLISIEATDVLGNSIETEVGAATWNQTVRVDHSLVANPDETFYHHPSLLYVRFQVHSGEYFTVCRQLWWHYVNMAGK